MKTFLIIVGIALCISHLTEGLQLTAQEYLALSEVQQKQHILNKCPEHAGEDISKLVKNSRDSLSELNMAGKTYVDGFTCESVLSKEEFKAKLTAKAKRPDQPTTTTTFRPTYETAGAPSAAAYPNPFSSRSLMAPANYVPVPDSFDYRSKGAVSSVKNQGRCGSCWTYSAAGALEGAIFYASRRLYDLSTQNMLDCVTKSFGCNGGYPTDVYEWVNKTQGINLDSSYPYIGVQSPSCKYTQAGTLTMRAFYEWTISGDETDLKYQLAYYGPVSVILDASQWQNYIGGVFKCSSSSTDYYSYNHAVLVVGYGNDPTLGDYWIVKNSWGTNWGEQGYIRIARNKGNTCGIATFATYPITFKPTGNPFKWD